jgi:DinB superfamily
MYKLARDVMTEVDRLADLLDRVLTGDPWHGPSVESLLSDVTAGEAIRKPVPGGHSIRELVLHMTGWALEVQARLGGAEAGEPAAGDWPAIRQADEASWDRDRRTLFAVCADLATAIRQAAPSVLDEPVLDHRDRVAGTGLSKYLTLHGLVHHTVYHAGQIAQLRRALR